MIKHLIAAAFFVTASLVFAGAFAGAPALPESIEDIDRESLDGRVVYLDFWASWCKPCRKSFPWMKRMQEKYGERGLVIVAVNVDRDRGEAERFLQEYAPNFDVVYDPEGRLAEQSDIEGMPSAFVFGRDGALRREHVGFRRRDRRGLEKTIVQLLREPAEDQ